MMKLKYKGYEIEFKKINDWWCAYVVLPEIKEEYKNQTYNEGRTFGVDTAHIWNTGQTSEEKLIDAAQQIQELIDDFESAREKGKV